GTATNSLVIDNSGVIRADDGTATFANGLIWGSSAGYGVFQATATNSQLLFTGPLQIPVGAMNVFIGPGTNRWLDGVSVAGNVQVGSGGPNSGNLEIRSASSGAGTITIAAGGQANWMAGDMDVSQITVAALGALTI